ncbi:hypothetical protein BIW53_12615 [Pseudoalteromonas byunsanensis]|uniref:Tryptophan halogenase n=2 Tax=Pseudoalteromonas byunsanensis TaxID=327939 RepID=A0A1S1N6M0_9GAMM|nr:hypothetical protein BIW53_12615 [Pseudoalteromonas byunsanensis]
MTATLINQAYNKHHKLVDIRLIESPDVDIIGVGEATVPAIKDFLQAAGIDEAEFMNYCNATFKNGIMFENWRQPKHGKMHRYVHPFDFERVEKRLDIATSWVLSERQRPFDESVSLASTLIQHNLTPKTRTTKPYHGIVHYSYHMDARLFGQFLRQRAMAAGVTRIEAHVESVNTDNGQISSIATTQGLFESDLFIDCTGFRALLISALEEKSSNWRSYQDELMCDSAVTVQIPHSEEHIPRSYTVAHALSCGWAWSIDLQNRTGNGYVYSSKYCSKEQAELEFRNYLKLDNNVALNHIDMSVGRRKRHWIGNCVAIGLAGGFIEPLESTGLHLIFLAARFLVLHNNFQYCEANIAGFNQTMNATYDELKDFIVTHYVLSDRDDSDFWRDISKTLDACPQLAQKLDLWQSKVCEFFDVSNSTSHMFTDTSYRYILFGMDHIPQIKIPYFDGEFTDVFEFVKSRQQKAVAIALNHVDYFSYDVKGQVTVKLSQ